MSQQISLTNLEKAKTLRETRKRMGWTQQRMAKELGLDSTYLSQLENDRRPVDEYYITRAGDIAVNIEKSKSSDVSNAYLAAAAYTHLGDTTLQTTFAELAAKFGQTPAAERKSLLMNLRAALNELEQREFRADLSSKPLSAEVEQALSAAPAARALAQESGRTQKAAAPSGDKRGPASGAAKH